MIYIRYAIKACRDGQYEGVDILVSSEIFQQDQYIFSQAQGHAIRIVGLKILQNMSTYICVAGCINAGSRGCQPIVNFKSISRD